MEKVINEIHLETLMKLKEKAPDFYSFLVQNGLRDVTEMVDADKNEQHRADELDSTEMVDADKNEQHRADELDSLNKYVEVLLQRPLSKSRFDSLVALCVGANYFSECFTLLYKHYKERCGMKSANRDHIEFLRNWCVQLTKVDLPNAYKHASKFIQQLPEILEEAPDGTETELYQWKYIHCLELWTAAICANRRDPDFLSLADSLVRTVSEAPCLYRTAEYVPFRLRCVKALNQIAAVTQRVIPCTVKLVLDTLEIKQFYQPPTKGKEATNIDSVLMVGSHTLETVAFQDAYATVIVLELGEHLQQCHCSVTFEEFSGDVLSGLSHLSKQRTSNPINGEIGRKIETLCEKITYTSSHTRHEQQRSNFKLSQRHGEASLVKAQAGGSSLSRYLTKLREDKANAYLREFSAHDFENSSFEVMDIDGDDGADSERDDVFSSCWLPGGESKGEKKQEIKKRSRSTEQDSAELRPKRNKIQ